MSLLQTLLEQDKINRFQKEQDAIDNFHKYGGQILDIVAKKGDQEAKIGINFQKTVSHGAGGKAKEKKPKVIYFVFYPDGAYDRFDNEKPVVYRSGWTGPDLPKKELEKSKEERDEEKRRKEEVAYWKARDREFKAAARKREERRKKWEHEYKYRDIKIPDDMKAEISQAETWFNQVINAIWDGSFKFETADEAFWGLLDGGFFTQYAKGATQEDVRRMADWPKKYQRYIGAEWVGNL